MEDVKIGDLLIRYNNEGYGTLAMDIHSVIDEKYVNEEDMQRLSELLTQINSILVPIINKTIKEHESNDN